MPPSGMKSAVLRQVWADNHIKEREFIREVVARHNYVTVLARVINMGKPSSSASSSASSSSAAAGTTLSTPDESYADFRQRDSTAIVLQLGMTFSDEAGNLPKDPESNDRCIWQFNVRVVKSTDEVDYSFQQKLTESGVDVQANMNYGIDPEVFSIGLWCIDTIMKDNIRWVVFCGTSTFGPLLKVMRAQPLPERREEFLELVGLFFPKFYEVRQLMASCGLSGTLEEVARVLRVAVGADPTDEAGARSLLTLHAFLALRRRHFRGNYQRIKPT